MKQFNARIDFRLPIKYTKRKKWYVASCPILDVVSQGETKAKAKKNLIEALAGFIESCIEHGTLDDVLRNCGFKFAKQVVLKRQTIPKEKDYIKVPISIITDFTSSKPCHA
jgi:predicted RNase H-like HicB family nuclease